MHNSAREFMRKTIISTAVLFAIYAAGMAVTSVSPPAKAGSSIDATPVITSLSYFPDQFVNQGANEAEIYILQF